MKLTVSFEDESDVIKRILQVEKQRLQGNLSYTNIEMLIENKYKFGLTAMQKLYITTSIFVANKSNEIIRYS